MRLCSLGLDTPQTTQSMAVLFLEVLLMLGAQGHTVWWLYHHARCVGMYASMYTLWSLHDYLQYLVSRAVTDSLSFCKSVLLLCLIHSVRGLQLCQLIFTWLDLQHQVAASGILCPCIFPAIPWLHTKHLLTLWRSVTFALRILFVLHVIVLIWHAVLQQAAWIRMCHSVDRYCRGVSLTKIWASLLTKMLTVLHFVGHS